MGGLYVGGKNVGRSECGIGEEIGVERRRKREQGAADRIQKGDGRILGACLTGIHG